MFAGQHLSRLLVSLAEPWGTRILGEPEGDDPLCDVREVHTVVSGAPSTPRARRRHRHLSTKTTRFTNFNRDINLVSCGWGAGLRISSIRGLWPVLIIVIRYPVSRRLAHLICFLVPKTFAGTIKTDRVSLKEAYHFHNNKIKRMLNDIFRRAGTF